MVSRVVLVVLTLVMAVVSATSMATKTIRLLNKDDTAYIIMRIEKTPGTPKIEKILDGKVIERGTKNMNIYKVMYTAPGDLTCRIIIARFKDDTGKQKYRCMESKYFGRSQNGRQGSDLNEDFPSYKATTQSKEGHYVP